jgi:hypothetical protein
VGNHYGVNTSRDESVAYDASAVQEYDTSVPANIMPSINADVQMLGPDAWELELLGEDSLWANLPILSNFMSVQESEPYGYVSTCKFTLATSNLEAEPILMHKEWTMRGKKFRLKTGPSRSCSSHFEFAEILIFSVIIPSSLVTGRYFVIIPFIVANLSFYLPISC